jgi:hypothetical protein
LIFPDFAGKSAGESPADDETPSLSRLFSALGAQRSAGKAARERL